ncbi:MAG TPA: Ppx/GppA phosphatase family protein [Ignavibacteriaceae bacterium]|nr:Ppx/GppA phosphatase family protein [Ignavibacteriaceae bacterium]
MRNKRIAALDLGSNSFHMIIGELKDNNSFEIIERKREVLRLASQKKGEHSYITEDETDKSILVIKDFKQTASRYGAEIKAVATRAVREAINGKDFTERIFKETSIKVEIISGEKEAELIFLGASDWLGLFEKKILVIDIGGGSTEIIIGADKKIVFSGSLKLGAVRIIRNFFPGFIISPERITLCRNFIKEELVKSLKDVSGITYDTAAGASGTILSVASSLYFGKHHRYPDLIRTIQITFEELKVFAENLLAKSTVKERLLIPGIEEKRADILPAGVLILQELFSFFKINIFNISEYGLREGIILSYLGSNKNPG